MIDSDGYRPNVGIIISNGKGQLMWARRYAQNSWQFPQGGINQGETAEQAMYRELYEEVGLRQDDVKILAVSRVWLRYKLPKRMVRWDSKPLCIGQKQRWFLLELTSNDDAVNMIGNTKPEFDGFRWVTYWYPVRQVVSFKRDVYRRALKEFAPYVLAQQSNNDEYPCRSFTVSFDRKSGQARTLVTTEKYENSGKTQYEAYAYEKPSAAENDSDKPLTPESGTLTSPKHLTKENASGEPNKVIEPHKAKPKNKKKGRAWPKRFKKNHKNSE